MTVKERILTIKLIEKVKRDPEHAKQLGISIVVDDSEEEESNGNFKKHILKNC